MNGGIINSITRLHLVGYLSGESDSVEKFLILPADAMFLTKLINI
jgi:hypothetical protein